MVRKAKKVILNCIFVDNAVVFGCFEIFENLVFGDFVFTKRMSAGGMAASVILYFFEQVADNGLNMVESFGSKKDGRVASSRDENKRFSGPRIVFGSVSCQSN